MNIIYIDIPWKSLEVQRPLKEDSFSPKTIFQYGFESSKSGDYYFAGLPGYT